MKEKQQLELKEVDLVASEDFCSECQPKAYRLLANLTGLDMKSLKNGGQYIAKTAFYVGKQIMEVKGTEAINENSARKIAFEAIKWLKENKLASDELQKRELEIKELKREIKEKDKRYSTDVSEIREMLAKLTYSPFAMGKMQEKQIATRLKTVAKNDTFTTEKSTKSGEDVLAKVTHQNKEVGAIVVESKNVKQWSNDFVNQTKRYMKKEGTAYAIIATTVLPDDKTNDKMYEITNDGIWIVRLDYLEVAYRALRDLLIKVKDVEIESNKKISDFTKLMKRFKDIVSSQEYQSKFTEIAQKADKLRQMSDRLRDYSKGHCDTLNEIAKNLIENINDLENMNKQAIVET